MLILIYKLKKEGDKYLLKLAKQYHNKNIHSQAFTIVELLVVIVVIGILAAITIVSYTGISSKANIAAISSDLSNAKKQFAMYYAIHSAYPTNLDSNNCPTGSTLPSPDINYCLKPSPGNSFAIPNSTGTGYELTATRGNLDYKVTENTAPTVTTSNWITVGSQTWAKTNLNVGTMVTGATTQQLNNSNLEKYCYDDLESNCTTYGAFYQWGEAMQYVTTASAQGICPIDSHIPSDNDLKILEIELGMTQAQADLNDWRGTDQGTRLKAPNGSSGLNIPLTGYHVPGGEFVGLLSHPLLWSSSESGTSAWNRSLMSSQITVARNTNDKTYGFSVRCLKN